MVVAVKRESFPVSLPDIRTPLRGRGQESTALQALLLDPATFLVTITGTGGVGKTRLAIEIATALRDEFDGYVAFVPLASIRDPFLALPEIGKAVGFVGDPHDDYEQRLGDHLANHRGLIVLDNLEQVMDAAPLLARLHAAWPGIVLLVTSRTALRIADEQVVPLQPLSVPDENDLRAGEALESDAVTLFVERACAVDPHLHLDDDAVRTIAGICRHLDGLPLAIELAAARMNVMSPRELLSRIDESFGIVGGERPDVDPRHRTIHNAIAWSYDLLSPAEMALLRQLSVFEGGFAADAVEAFPQHDDARNNADLLDVLVLHHLVTEMPGGSRYLMLESIRDFGIDRLREREEEDAARAAHAAYIASVAEFASKATSESGQRLWLSRFDAELANTRSAIAWAGTATRADTILRIAGSLRLFMESRGLMRELQTWLLEGLRHPTPDHLPARLQAMIVTGQACFAMGSIDQGVAWMEQAQTLAAAIGDSRQEGMALMSLGAEAIRRDDLDTATTYLHDAATLVTEVADPYHHAMIVSNTGYLSFRKGRPREAIAYFERSSQVFEAMGDVHRAMIQQMSIGQIEIDNGRYEDGEKRLLQIIAYRRTSGDRFFLTPALIAIGEMCLALGDFDRARATFEEVRDLNRENGLSKWVGDGLIGLSYVASEQGDILRAAEILLDALESIVDFMDAPFFMHAEDQAVNLLAKSGEATTAARMFGYVRRDFTGEPHEMSAFNEVFHTDLEASIRVQLPPGSFERLVAEGARMEVDDLNRELQRLMRQMIGRQRPETPVPHLEETLDEVTDIVDSFGLTPREMETLHLLASGHSTKEIASVMNVSVRTVATHVANIMAKMDVTSRTAAVAKAMRAGLVSRD